MELDGNVVRIIREKKLAFVRVPDGRDLLVHADMIPAAAFGTLYEGASVVCEAYLTERGWRARAVRIREPVPPSVPAAAAGNAITRYFGAVAQLITERRFGFIRSSSGQRVFFHAADLRDVNFDDLVLKMSVSYLPQQGTQGPRAADVRRVYPKDSGLGDDRSASALGRKRRREDDGPRRNAKGYYT